MIVKLLEADVHVTLPTDGRPLVWKSQVPVNKPGGTVVAWATPICEVVPDVKAQPGSQDTVTLVSVAAFT